MILYRSEPDMDNISRFQKTTGVGQILDESFAPSCYTGNFFMCGFL